ncbi:MAG: VTT domain-containing protein [Verrucomicrobiota bacterium]
MSKSDRPKSSPWSHWLIWTLLLAGLAIVFWRLALSGYDWRDLLESDSPYRPLIFVSLMTLMPVVGFPISAFYIFAGIGFEPVTAISLGLLSLSLNMSLSYLLARTIWREPMRKKFAERWPKAFTLDETSASQITILIRAIPGIPFWTQNYILGVLAVPFINYLSLSLLIQGCFLTGVVLTTRGAMNQDGQMALWGGLSVALVLIGLRMVLKRRKGLRS